MTDTAFPLGISRRRPAFTLVELLVSMAVLTLMTTCLFGLLNSVNQLWTKSQAQVEPQRNGRAILDVIARDLRSAALPADRTNVTTSLQFVVNPPTTAVPASYDNPQSLFWQAPVATDSNSAGNQAEVGYFVRWDTTNASNPRALLCRFLVNPSSANYLIYTQPTSPQTVSWLTQSLLDTVAPGTAASNYTGWVADNVIALWARVLDVNGQPITKNAVGTTVNYVFDSRQGYQDVSGNIKNGTSTQILAALPASVEIAIVMIDPRTALRVSSNLSPAAVDTSLAQIPANFWSDIAKYTAPTSQGGKLPAFVQQAAVVYTTRVPLANSK